MALKRVSKTLSVGAQALMTAWIISGCGSHRDATAEYHAAYDFPLASPGARFATLPPPVQHTIRAEAGSANITDIKKFQRRDETLYRVDFANPELYPPLYVSTDGSLLNPNLTVAKGAPADISVVTSGGPVTNVKLSELPEPVLKTISGREAGAEIDYINKDTWGDRVVYIITFKDPAHHPRMHVASDGTVLNQGPK
jgi:hypothetical protein